MSRQINIQKILQHDFASKPEAALYLEVVERTLDRWIEQDDGPPVTLIRKKQFFDKRALADFKRQRELRKKGARQ